FFFFSFSIGVIFFWVNSSVFYLWSLIFLVTGLTMITSLKTNLLHLFLLSLCFVFVGGAAESMAVNILMLLAATIVYILFKSRWNFRTFWDRPESMLVLIAICSLAA